MGLSLEVGEFDCEFGRDSVKFGDGIGEILFGESGRSEWITKETKTCGDFGGYVPGIGR